METNSLHGPKHYLVLYNNHLSKVICTSTVQNITSQEMTKKHVHVFNCADVQPSHICHIQRLHFSYALHHENISEKPMFAHSFLKKTNKKLFLNMGHSA